MNCRRFAPLLLAPLVLAVLLLSGCTEEQARRAEAAAAQIEQRVEQLDEAIAVARQALAVAQVTAPGSETVARAQEIVDKLEEARPEIVATAREAREAATAARESVERGGSWWEMGLAVAGSLLMGGGAAGAAASRLLGRWKGTAAAAIQLAQTFKPHAEAADADGAAAAIKKAAAVHDSLGTRGAVDRIRYGG